MGLGPAYRDDRSAALAVGFTRSGLTAVTANGNAYREQSMSRSRSSSIWTTPSTLIPIS